MPSEPQSERRYIAVALPLPVKKNFTYIAPELGIPKPGARVLVPFGKRAMTGYVVGFPTEPEPQLLEAGHEVKEVIELVDDEPLITEEILRLTRWAADYYAASWGEMLKASLPAGINATVEQVVETTAKGHLELAKGDDRTGIKWKVLARSAATETTLGGLAAEFGEASARRAVRELERSNLVLSRQRSAGPGVKAKRRKIVRLLDSGNGRKPFTDAQQRVIDTLRSARNEILLSELLEAANVSASTVNALAHRGAVAVEMKEVLRDPLDKAELPAIAELKLNAEQSFVLSEINEALRHGEFRSFLLHGVTGSGKTEVYIRAMRQAMAEGKGALMLVPEIALTPIFSRRLRSVFGQQVAILHSALSSGERFDEWRRIKSGLARVVIGTRSAIFAPVEKLGLIVVDEEHDASYRQGEPPHYNARDLAVMRANDQNAVAVLGSATPSLESFHNARSGKYVYLQLRSRIGGRPMAAAELIDMREVFKRAGKDVLVSPDFAKAISETHAKGEQSMILLNRRGFSSFVLCRSCGESLRCVNCDITLTYHRRDSRILCHYCAYSTPTPQECPFCQSQFLYFIGQGTEQLEDVLARQFPELRIARIDRDTMKKKGQIDRVLLAFDRGETDMLVGTQMLAKGHDFHNVTLVGVISVDIGLGLPDFRSAERTFQLLTQVAGRAGRGDLPGRVLVQTYHPEHYALRYAIAQDYEAFYEHEIRFRVRMAYPPFVALALILVRHKDLDRAQRTAAILRESLNAVNIDRECQVLGPAAAPISRLKNEHRLQIIIRSRSRRALRKLLDEAIDRAAAYGGDARNFTIDIDPVSMM